MKSNIECLLEEQLEFKNGVAYLIPAKWWEQFKENNEKIASLDQLYCAPLSLEKYVDTFLLEFKESIVAELEHKTNYLKFNKVWLSPQPNKSVEWALISSAMWRLINDKVKNQFGLITVYDDQNPGGPLSLDTIQVQIVFCSKTKSDVFVGFLPQFADSTRALRTIGFQLGFVEMTNSRVIFPDLNPDKSYYYCELENLALSQAQDTLFLAYNLENVDEKDNKPNPLNFSFGKEDELGNSNEAMAGDLGPLAIESFDQIRNDGTMSTGAETPSFFGSEEENLREFRVRELFRQKKPEEIEELRRKAKKIVRGNLIPVIQHREEELGQQLEAIVQDLFSYISHHKKKAHKQKEYHQ